jgi:hypothetical protein
MMDYQDQLSAIPAKISIGYQTIRIFLPNEVEPMQVGYSVSREGRSLIGSQEGDWLAQWKVIGCEEMCGDPIFIDESQDGFPVFTAVHGEGHWDPKKIAISMKSFGEALTNLAVLAKGREFPTAFEGNPVTESERRTFLDAIERNNPGIDLEFWELLLTP